MESNTINKIKSYLDNEITQKNKKKLWAFNKHFNIQGNSKTVEDIVNEIKEDYLTAQNYIENDLVRKYFEEIVDFEKTYSKTHLILYHCCSNSFIFMDLICKIITKEDHYSRYEGKYCDKTALEIYENFNEEYKKKYNTSENMKDNDNPDFCCISKSCCFTLFDNLEIGGENVIGFLTPKSQNINATFEKLLENIKLDVVVVQEIKSLYKEFNNKTKKCCQLVVYTLPHENMNKFYYKSSSYGFPLNIAKLKINQARIVNLNHSNEFLKENNIIIKKYNEVSDDIICEYEEKLRLIIKKIKK